MILDKENIMSEDQAVTANARSTNVIDLGNDDSYLQALNEKGELELFVQVTTAFAGGASTSIKASLVSSDSSTFSTGNTTISESAAISSASLTQGYTFKFGKLPRINQQYISMFYTAVSTITAGAIFAALALDRQTNGN